MVLDVEDDRAQWYRPPRPEARFWRTWVRRLAIVPMVAVLASFWLVAPMMVAAGLALDHPAWSDPDVDHPLPGTLRSNSSWWPPGQRYSWIAQPSGPRVQATDPWGAPSQGHLWTAAVATAGLTLIVRIWRGRRPSPAPGVARHG